MQISIQTLVVVYDRYFSLFLSWRFTIYSLWMKKQLCLCEHLFLCGRRTLLRPLLPALLGFVTVPSRDSDALRRRIWTAEREKEEQHVEIFYDCKWKCWRTAGRLSSHRGPQQAVEFSLFFTPQLNALTEVSLHTLKLSVCVHLGHYNLTLISAALTTTLTSM